VIKLSTSLLSDFLIVILISGLLLLFKTTIVHESIWIYDIAWVVLAVTTIGLFFLRPRKTKAALSFPHEQVKRIEKALPYDAIKIYRSWFVLSLERCYNRSKNRLSKSARSDLAKALADKLVLVFNCVPKDSLYKVLEDRNKDNALIALIFFTTIIQVLKSKAAHTQFNKPISRYRDVFTWITLERAETFLFREHYRLYELGVLVGELWDLLNFNADIEPILKSVLLSPLLADTSQSKGKKQAESEMNISVLSEKKSEDPQQQTVNIDQSMQAISCNADDEITAKFFKWLKRQMIRKPINSDQCFYQDRKQHDETVIFISDGAWLDFSKKAQVSESKIKSLLAAQKYSDGTSYRLKQEGVAPVRLWAVTVDFAIDCSHELAGSIEEEV
jgi:hypothetical protein